MKILSEVMIGLTVVLLGVARGAEGVDLRSGDKKIGGPARQDSPLVWVGFREGLLSVKAKPGSWKEIVDGLGQKTWILFHFANPLEGSVKLSFQGLPLKQALERLFGREADFVFRYPEGADPSESLSVPNEVWVLGKVGREGPVASPVVGAKAEAEPASAPSAEEPVEVNVSADDQEQVDLLLDMSRDKDAQVRGQAISALAVNGTADEDTIRSALHAALEDEDANVRGYAVQAAVATRGGPEAMGYVAQALRDGDPGVRTMAVESVLAEGQGIALLEQALSDPDEAVRAVATARLNPEPERM